MSSVPAPFPFNVLPLTWSTTISTSASLSISKSKFIESPFTSSKITSSPAKRASFSSGLKK
jgi:hypothetical protein